MAELLETLGWMLAVPELICLLVLQVAVGTILAALTNALAGWLPARRAYATDVASHLVPPS